VDPGVRIIVTRVQPQAQQWVEQLQKLGFDACALPLIEVRAVQDVAPLQAAWRALPNYAAVMFVSRAAVDFFFKESNALAFTDKASDAIQTRFWATGPGTARALLAQGVAAAQLDSPSEQSGQFDSETLWARVQSQVKPGDRVLIVRGDSEGDEQPSNLPRPGVGRDWLADQLTHAGAQASFVVAYRRGPPLWSALDQALARASATDGSLWLLSSSEAVAHLQGLLPGQGWSSAQALATHPRIAEAARHQGFGQVEVTRPALEDVVASIKSFV
jgi:uroporphyrinogen-III synthase